jgi:drug/metabolite transporter (DMT)-like permease
LFAAMGVLWGISYLLIKVAVAEVPVPMVVFVRTAGAAALLFPLAARSMRWTVLRRHWLPLLGFAVLEIILPWGLLSDAERKLTSSLAGLLVAAVPIVGLVASRLLGDTERIGPLRWTGLALGLAGVAVLVGPAVATTPGGGQVLPVLEMALVVLGYAVAPLIAARRLTEVPDLVTLAVCLGFGGLVYAPVAVRHWPAELPSASALAALAGLAVFCTAVAFVVFFALLREVGPGRAMVFTYVNPAVAVLAGVLVLDEPLSWSIVASFGLIICGSVLATASRPVRRAPEPCVITKARLT